MVHETKDNTKLYLNICLSYGSRGEITNACQSIVDDMIQNGTIKPSSFSSPSTSLSSSNYNKKNKPTSIQITESMLSNKMLTSQIQIQLEKEYNDKTQPQCVSSKSSTTTIPCPDPDILIRTSGEYRISNFLLWQCAYSELFFIDKNWPEMTKKDLVKIIREYVVERKRRFGK